VDRDELIELAARTLYERDRAGNNKLDPWDTKPWLQDLYRIDVTHIVDLVLANTQPEGPNR
jgi:hypothetical protein